MISSRRGGIETPKKKKRNHSLAWSCSASPGGLPPSLLPLPRPHSIACVKGDNDAQARKILRKLSIGKESAPPSSFLPPPLPLRWCSQGQLQCEVLTKGQPQWGTLSLRNLLFCQQFKVICHLCPELSYRLFLAVTTNLNVGGFWLWKCGGVVEIWPRVLSLNIRK